MRALNNDGAFLALPNITSNFACSTFREMSKEPGSVNERISSVSPSPKSYDLRYGGDDQRACKLTAAGMSPLPKAKDSM